MHTIGDEIHKAEQLHHMAEQEHQKAIESLIKSADKLNIVFEAMNEGVLVSDTKGIITNSNERLSQMLGYKSRDDIIGKSIFELILPENREKLGDIIHKCLTYRDRVIASFRILQAHGPTLSAELSISPLAGKANNPYGIVAIVRDMMEHEESENTIQTLNQSLRARTAELERVNKEFKDFSFSISNELKAPLRRVEGFSRAIMEDYSAKLDEQGNYYLHRIEAESHLMAQLVDDMLKLYAVTLYETHFETVDLSMLAQDAADRAKDRYPGGPVNLIIEPCLKASGDRQLLQTVMMELFDNAFKFTSQTSGAEIEFGYIDNNGQETYFVKDNGLGFDMRFASRLFKPFQRLHGKPEFRGNGVGLSIAQRIIHRHGGEIWAESEDGKGTTIYFTLIGSGNQL